MFHYLFPFGSETSSLFAQLGDNDLYQLQLPSNFPGAGPPDRVYSVTAEIFPIKSRKTLEELLLNQKDHAAPYLTVFLTNRRDEDSSGRMKLWGVHMLEARVTEWRLATNKLPRQHARLDPQNLAFGNQVPTSRPNPQPKSRRHHRMLFHLQKSNLKSASE